MLIAEIDEELQSKCVELTALTPRLKAYYQIFRQDR